MKTGKLVVTAILAALIGGCTTTNDPYTRETKTSQTVKGAGIGAVIGGVAGALLNNDNRGKGALIGASIGAGVGGGIGYYMDQQEAKLRQYLQGSGVSVTRNGDTITINMPGNITFPTNGSSIKANFYDVLDSVALVLEEFNRSDLRITGHTDSTGSKGYNQDLSERRSASVGTYLQSRGVDPRRVYTIGYGEGMPIASNDSAYGREQNRRVELEILPPRR